MKSKVDFVILWVDGNDTIWKKEKELYIPKLDNEDNNSVNRYRDWENLKYWFRTIEKNAKWVNNIFFITYGHLPKWLNLNNPKLKIIKHEDFIPKEYLPTYNSNVIEFNLYRIQELSENFVLFNDDMFLLGETCQEVFFKDNKPVETYSECLNVSLKNNDIYTHNLLNNISIINKHFIKHEVYKKNLFKYINWRYGLKKNISTLLLLPFKSFSMIDNPHLPVALKKSVLEYIWKIEKDSVEITCKNRFRDLTDISQYLIRYFQLMSGEFYPRQYSIGKAFNLGQYNEDIFKDIEQNKYKLVCFNDSSQIDDFEKAKKDLIDFFEKKYYEKSEYEI